MQRPLVPVLSVLLAASATAQGWVDRTPVSPTQRPSNRVSPAMCWDAAHGYVLLFGGYAGFWGIGTNDTWTWDGSAWTQRQVAVPPYVGTSLQNFPAALAMTFHAPTNEVLLVVLDTTYSWNGTGWFSQPSGTLGPSPYGSPANIAMGRDPVRNQTLLYVGSRIGNPTRTDVSETFLWSGLGWNLIPTATQPYPVDYPSMTLDPVSGKLVLCTKGNGQTGFFEWNGNNWQQRLVAGAPAGGGTLATDSGNNCIVLFDAVMNQLPNHTWSLSNGNISQLSTPVEPARRWGAGMAYDPVRARTVMFGGANYLAFPPLFSLGDTWEFQLGPGPSYTTYGAGCAGSGGTPAIATQGTSLPHAGLNFQLHVSNLPLTAPTFLFFGVSDTSYLGLPLPLPLAGIGAPGCSVLSSAEQLHFLTNVLGTAVWNVTIPNFPGASFYNQAIVFDAAANPLGITTSNGGHGVIGF
jgi:hypothetical protein